MIAALKAENSILAAKSAEASTSYDIFKQIKDEILNTKVSGENEDEQLS